MEKRLLGVEELTEYIGIRPQTIYNRISRGIFPIPHKKVFGRIKFEKAAVDEYLDGLSYQHWVSDRRPLTGSGK